MAALVVFGEALALGLASGPACIAACGPVLVPTLLTGRAGFRANTGYLSAFLAARLLGYLLFAVVAWELGLLASLLPTPRLLMMGAVYVLLAVVLLCYSFAAHRMCAQPCAESKLVQITDNKTRGLAAAMLFFAAFFIGTSIWFIPFLSLGCIVRNQAVLTVARMAMALIALYYLSMGIAMLLGKKAYGY